MKLTLDPEVSRRFAWTDRKNGYLDFETRNSASLATGYHREGKTFFHDLFLSGPPDTWRFDALRTEVEPWGARIVFEEGERVRTIEVSLLVDEGALAVRLDSPDGGCGLLFPAVTPDGFRDPEAGNTPGDAGGSVSGRAANGPGRGDALGSGAGSTWTRDDSSGVTVYSLALPESAVTDVVVPDDRIEDRPVSPSAASPAVSPSSSNPEPSGTDTTVAIASSTPFIPRDDGEGRVVLLPDAYPAVWYVAFGAGSGDETAAGQAARLARDKGLAAHRAKVDAALSAVSLETGDAALDDALRWARFSGWMLVTDDGDGRGIWAGLPWFRENWGRDTFIALTGILLAGGHFAEARSVLTGFARHQNRDTESPDWGRIPNRWRGGDDAIYNAADGTLWFIRALWEYLQYTGDRSLAGELSETVDLALRADLGRRADHNGFLLHGDADTWMDARIRGDGPWSPRGDRAVEVQALWYTALRIGAKLARLRGDAALAADRDGEADRVRSSFARSFWSGERNALADRLPPGAHGEWARDFAARPNQLFAIHAPSVLAAGEELLGPARRRAVLENAERELVSPFGLYSLAPEDPRFHPRHGDEGRYHKDAAYHNGTVWVWNAGPYISAACREGRGALRPMAEALLRNEARMLLGPGCAGTLPENIHALPAPGGDPVLSGAWSQAWSVAEFARNFHEDLLGFRPRLMEGRIELAPSFPTGIDRVSADLPLGADRGSEGGPGAARVKLEVFRERDGTYRALAFLDAPPSFPAPLLNGFRLLPGTRTEIEIDPPRDPAPGIGPAGDLAPGGDSRNSARAVPGSPAADAWIVAPFPVRDLEPPWCGALSRKDWLETLILSGRAEGAGGGPFTAELEDFFDSDLFRRNWETKGRFGALWSPGGTEFRLWAPTARRVSLALWSAGSGGEPLRVIPMVRGSGGAAKGEAGDAGHADAERADPGTWSVSVPGDLHGVYYTWRVLVHGIERETPDPAARAGGVNGRRSMVADFARTDPPGWDAVSAPSLASPNDAVAYELHVADATSSPTWRGPEILRRRYAGVTAPSVTCVAPGPGGGLPRPAGFDHFRDLGITHVQLLPVFDYGSVDESLHDDPGYGLKLVGGKFNWGYDPQNYSVPEGSYSTDPFDGVVRIRELKAMIRNFLAAGIGVIMDVVYNHVPAARDHALGICVPGYYFRARGFSGAGDDTASERAMFREYMIDSLSHWLAEYKLSGFRFDLMGLHDVETMNGIVGALRKIKPDVLLYGEGWDMYRGGKTVGASMLEAGKMPGIGFFNDAFRCGIKGDAFSPSDGGFVHDGSRRESVKFGIVGAVRHTQVNNRDVVGTANPNPWGGLTAASVNYTEIHDNNTLYDKLVLVEPGRDEAHYEALQRIAIGLVLLSQGMPILHAGMEFMRTKEIPPELLAENPGLGDVHRGGERAFTHNSYNLSDRINGLDWGRRAEKDSLVAFTRALIGIRKTHAHFRLRTEAEVAACLAFLGPDGKGGSADAPKAPGSLAGDSRLLAWSIDDPTGSDAWARVCAVVNPGEADATFVLPPPARGGLWRLALSSAGEGESGKAPILPEGLPPGAPVTVPAKALYLYAEF